MMAKKAFTLLEIIIVIIIVGVLAGIALPKFLRTVEFSRSVEALTAITAIRGAAERCYVINNGSYANCLAGSTTDSDWSNSTLDIENPATSPNSHFDYAVWPIIGNGFVIRAIRNTRDGGASENYILMGINPSGITKSGGGIFSTIK